MQKITINEARKVLKSRKFVHVNILNGVEHWLKGEKLIILHTKNGFLERVYYGKIERDKNGKVFLQI